LVLFKKIIDFILSGSGGYPNILIKSLKISYWRI